MRISRSGECGNSPKNELVEDIAIALAQSDPTAFDGVISDDFRRVTVGDAISQGKDTFLRQLEADAAADAVTVFHVSSHGKTGAVNGEMALKSGNIAFCHVIEFTSAASTSVKTITSYLIPLDYRY